MMQTYKPRQTYHDATPLDVGAIRRQLRAQRGAGDAGDAGASVAYAAYPAPTQPQVAAHAPGYAPEYTTPSDSVAAYAPAPTFTTPPEFSPSAERGGDVPKEQSGVLPPSLEWMFQWGPMIGASAAGLATAALFSLTGLAGEGGQPLAVAAGAGAVAWGSAFFYLRRIRRSVLRAVERFSESPRSKPFWAVFAAVFTAMVGLSVYGVVSAGPDAESLSLAGWLMVSVKSGALAVIIARLAQKHVFERGQAT